MMSQNTGRNNHFPQILIACERSGRVRDAINLRAGKEIAVSCDLYPSETPGPHIIGDVRDHLDDGWIRMIAFPDCTHLASSGARWFPEKRADGRQQAAIEFFMEMINAPINQIAVENPIGIMSSEYRKPDQIIHPWWFGDFGENEKKSTCLWLKNLPKLEKINPLPEPHNDTVHRMPPGPCRAMDRARTFRGVAAAMAERWGAVPA